MFTIRSATGLGSPARLHVGRPIVRWLHAALVCVAFFGTTSVAADKPSPVDRQAIEATIRSQLEAFGREDADGAFRFASPDIQRLFRSADAFMAMVREHYAPVYRATSVNFVKLETAGGQWIETVQLVDGEGRVWRALFTMRRQPDKSWKVGGCQLVQTSAIAT